MPVINYLTTCIFDSGALKQLAGTAKKLGMTRPFIVTDPGIKARSRPRKRQPPTRHAAPTA